MLIACPACASEYEIEAARLGPEGRSVRCAACRQTWFVPPDAAGEAPAPDAFEVPDWEAQPVPDPGGDAPGASAEVLDHPAPPPRARPARARRKPPTGLAARLSSWPSALKPSPAIAAGLVAFVILPLGLLGRATVVRAMPQSASLFAAVGLAVNLRGVDIRDVVAFRNPAEGDRPAQLTVEGDLIGVARGRVEVPPLEVELRDARDQPFYRWTVSPPRAALEPGETARFRASLAPPPPQGVQVQVRFARQAEPAEAVPARVGAAADPAAHHSGH